jgi:hypothetical protein
MIMTMRFRLEVEETLPGFNVTRLPPESTPVAILNENAPQGLFDRIIKHDQAWSVTTRFRVGGVVSDAIGPGTWTLTACLVSLCGGADASFTTTQPYSVAPGPDDYSIVVNVPAGGVADGVYKLYVSIDLDTGATVPVTMFAEGPMVKFYTPS